MKASLYLAFAVGLIAVATALKCNVCHFRTLSVCIEGSGTTNCTGSCSVTKAYFGKVNVFSKQGCSSNCQATNSSKDSVFDFTYDVSCCNTDQCNAGNSVKVSMSLGLGMALLWLLNAV